MSNGYTPLFGSLTTGTLCGKWPDIGLWAIVLALADWQGIVDATPHYISNVTGLPVIEVKACMQRFCEPDPDSRSKVESGARLMLVDPQREWGWRVVNIQLYRDRASGKDQIMDGRNAEKVRRYKDRHRQTPPDTAGHPATPTHTTDLNSDTDSEKNKTPVANATPPEGVEGLDSVAWSQWIAYRTSIRKPVKPASIPAAQRKLAAHGTSQAAVVEHSIANGYTGLYASKDQPPQQNGGQKLEKIYPGYRF